MGRRSSRLAHWLHGCGRTVAALAATASIALRLLALRLPGVGRRGASGSLGRHLADRVEGLGGVYLKVGQILSTRPDLLSEPDRQSLARLCDRVRAPTPESCLASLHRGLGADRLAKLCDLEADPIAAGSVTHVHAGRRRDSGQQVAIKVLRDDVAPSFAADLAAMRAATRIGALLPPLRSVPMSAAAESLTEAIGGNLDMRREADRHARFAAQLTSSAILVPRLHPDLCTARVVVMDLVPDAVRIDDPRLDRDRRRTAVLSALRALYEMLFRSGLVHCDLHPGNLLISPQGQLVLIDFGYTAEMTADQREAFAELFLGIALNEPGRVNRVLIDTATRLPRRLDEAALLKELDGLIAASSETTAETFSVSRFVAELFAIQRRYGIVASPGFTMGILALVSLEGSLKGLAPDVDFQREALPYVVA